MFSQFSFAYAANLKLFQQRHLTREEYLVEQRAGPEAAEKHLFPVNVEGAQLKTVFISVSQRVPKICWSILGSVGRIWRKHEQLECCQGIFGKHQNSSKNVPLLPGDKTSQTKLLF